MDELLKMKRRTFLKLVGGISALTLAGLSSGCSNKKDTDDVTAPEGFPDVSQFSGQKPEAEINLDTGEVKVDDSIVIRHSACLGCYSSCGNRVKIDKQTGKILKVFGNPYNPNNAEPHLSLDAPLTDSYLAFSTYKDMQKYKGTLCARGNATLEAHYDPMRILVPLKRTGPRGSGKWKPITWDEVVEETAEGGQLFKEIGEDTNIDGFRKVRDLETLIDPNAPELGPVANQLVLFGGRGDGRGGLTSKFKSAFGTVNNYGHGHS